MWSMKIFWMISWNATILCGKSSKENIFQMIKWQIHWFIKETLSCGLSNDITRTTYIHRIFWSIVKVLWSPPFVDKFLFFLVFGNLNGLMWFFSSTKSEIEIISVQKNSLLMKVLSFHNFLGMWIKIFLNISYLLIWLCLSYLPTYDQ